MLEFVLSIFLLISFSFILAVLGFIVCDLVSGCPKDCPECEAKRRETDHA